MSRWGGGPRPDRGDDGVIRGDRQPREGWTPEIAIQEYGSPTVIGLGSVPWAGGSSGWSPGAAGLDDIPWRPPAVEVPTVEPYGADDVVWDDDDDDAGFLDGGGGGGGGGGGDTGLSWWLVGCVAVLGLGVAFAAGRRGNGGQPQR